MSEIISTHNASGEIGSTLPISSCGVKNTTLTASNIALCSKDLLEKTYNDLQNEIQDKSGEDVSGIFYKTKAPEILDGCVYSTEILRPMVEIIAKFLSDMSPILGYSVGYTFGSITAKSKSEEYIIESFSKGNPNTTIKELEDALADIVNLGLGPYTPRLFYHLEEVIVKFHGFVSSRDHIYERIVEQNSDYEVISSENTQENCYPNLPGIFGGILSEMKSNPESIIQKFELKDVERTMKIFVLLDILIQYLYSYNDPKKTRKPEYRTVLSSFCYLLELIGYEPDDKNLSLGEEIKIIFGNGISTTQYRKFLDSGLYNEFILQRKLPTNINRFLASIALKSPKRFISKHSVPYEKTLLILSKIQDLTRQGKLINIIAKIPDNCEWIDEDLALLVFLGLEELTYFHNLSSDDITFIYNTFCREDDGEIIIIQDVNMLFQLKSYDAFCIMKALNTNEESLELAQYMLESQDNFKHAMKYAESIQVFQNDLKYVPSFFTKIHILAGEVLSSEAYKLEIDKIKEKIQNLKSSTNFDAIVLFHKAIFENTPPDQQDMDIVNSAYAKVGVNYIMKETAGDLFLQDLLKIGAEKKHLLLAVLDNILLGKEHIDKILGEWPECLIFLEENDIGEESPTEEIFTAVELFIEDRRSRFPTLEFSIYIDLSIELESIFGEENTGIILNLYHERDDANEILHTIVNIGSMINGSISDFVGWLHDGVQNQGLKNIHNLLIFFKHFGVSYFTNISNLFTHVHNSQEGTEKIGYLHEKFKGFTLKKDVEDEFRGRVIKFFRDDDYSIIGDFSEQQDLVLEQRRITNPGDNIILNTLKEGNNEQIEMLANKLHLFIQGVQISGFSPVQTSSTGTRNSPGSGQFTRIFNSYFLNLLKRDSQESALQYIHRIKIINWSKIQGFGDIYSMTHANLRMVSAQMPNENYYFFEAFLGFGDIMRGLNVGRKHAVGTLSLQDISNIFNDCVQFQYDGFIGKIEK